MREPHHYGGREEQPWHAAGDVKAKRDGLISSFMLVVRPFAGPFFMGDVMYSVWWVRMKIAFWFLVFMGMALSFAVPAFAFEVMPSTPDISVSDSATSEINLGRTANWLYLKNDCAADVYIDLRGFDSDQFSLRLKNGESFSAEITTRTLGVSPGATASGCTLTVIPAR